MDQQDKENESEVLKEAISFKKDKHRVEIRKKNLATTLRNKRLAMTQANGGDPSQETLVYMPYGGESEQEQNLGQQPIQYHMQNEPQQEGIQLSDYVKSLNQICDARDCHNQEDKVIRCLKILRAYIMIAIQENNDNTKEQYIQQFTSVGGCECVLQFLDNRYKSLPLIQLEALTIIGNIFALSCEQILNLLIQCGVVKIVFQILESCTSDLVEFQEDLKLQDEKRPLLAEAFRALGNMAGESYSIRMELVWCGICRYFNGKEFALLLNNVNAKIVNQVLFLIKNILIEMPPIDDEFREQLIPILAALFSQGQLDPESTLDALLGIKSMSKYGDTILRGKMLSYKEAFQKLHSTIDPQSLQDWRIVLTGLETLRDYMRYSTNQAEYVLNVAGDSIFNHLLYYLLESHITNYSNNSNTNNSYNNNNNISNKLMKTLGVKIQTAAVDIIHLYIAADNPIFFTEIFEQHNDLISTVIQIASLNPDNKLNYSAVELLFTAIERATYSQQQTLIQMGILLPMIDSIQEDGISFMYKSLKALTFLISVAHSQINQHPNYIQFNPVLEQLQQNYKFEQILEKLQLHPNQDISNMVSFLFENFINSN